MYSGKIKIWKLQLWNFIPNSNTVESIWPRSTLSKNYKNYLDYTYENIHSSTKKNAGVIGSKVTNFMVKKIVLVSAIAYRYLQLFIRMQINRLFTCHIVHTCIMYVTRISYIHKYYCIYNIYYSFSYMSQIIY